MRQWCTDDSGGVPCDGCGLPALFFMFCLVMEGALFQVLCWSLEGDLFELYFNLDLDRGNPVFGRCFELGCCSKVHRVLLRHGALS